MVVETTVTRALDRVERERDHMNGRLRGVERFEKRVEKLEPVPGPDCRPATDGGAITPVQARPSAGSGCGAVREAFVETVRPHSVEGTEGVESVVETIREEFDDRVAYALATTTETRFTAETKWAVLAAAQERRSEIEALLAALQREQSSLESAVETVDGITAWLIDANEIPLSECGFEELTDRHDRLERYREACDELARTRQATVRSVTSEGAAAAIEHGRLLRFLYDEFSTSYPVLSTVARICELLEEAGHTLRDHLVRRV